MRPRTAVSSGAGLQGHSLNADCAQIDPWHRRSTRGERTRSPDPWPCARSSARATRMVSSGPTTFSRPEQGRAERQGALPAHAERSFLLLESPTPLRPSA